MAMVEAQNYYPKHTTIWENVASRPQSNMLKNLPKILLGIPKIFPIMLVIYTIMPSLCLYIQSISSLYINSCTNTPYAYHDQVLLLYCNIAEVSI